MFPDRETAKAAPGNARCAMPPASTERALLPVYPGARRMAQPGELPTTSNPCARGRVSIISSLSECKLIRLHWKSIRCDSDFSWEECRCTRCELWQPLAAFPLKCAAYGFAQRPDHSACAPHGFSRLLRTKSPYIGLPAYACRYR